MKPSRRAVCRLAVGLFAAAAFFAQAAQGDNALVLTQARTAAGDPAALYLHAVSTALHQYAPDPLRLSGDIPLGDIEFSPDGRIGILLARYVSGLPSTAPRSRRTALNVFQTNPLRTFRVSPDIYESGWELRKAIAGPAGDAAGLSILLLERRTSAFAGRMRLLRMRPDGRDLDVREVESQALSGVPVDVEADWDTNRVWFLTSVGPDERSRLLRVDMQTGERRAHWLDIEDAAPRWGVRPVGLRLSPDTRRLFVLTTAYNLDRSAGDAISRLHLFDAATLEASAPPLEVPGVGIAQGFPLTAHGPNRLWTATQTTGGQFAYAIQTGSTNDGWSKLRETAFTQASRPPLVAPAPGGARVAIAGDRRIEIWTATAAPAPVARTLDSPIGAIAWLDSGLFAGEAGVLHALDPETAATKWTLPFRNGHIERIAPLPPPEPGSRDGDADGLTDAAEGDAGTAPDNPDTDGDGLSDGRDPEPLRPNAALDLPAAVHLDPAARGRSQRTLVFDVPEGASWKAHFDPRDAPWLDVVEYPISGARGAVTLRLSSRAGATSPGASLHTRVRVMLRAGRSGEIIAGNPHDILVSFTAPEVPAALIQWHTGGLPARGEGYDALQRLLAGPPTHFSHLARTGPIVAPPPNARAVVLDLRAAEQGALTRQVLLDYVAAGGGLLLVGRHDPETAATGLRRWLEPLGILIEPATPVRGRYAIAADHPFAHYADALRFESGCRILVSESAGVDVPAGSETEAALAMRPYGFGRIAVLAGPEPLAADTLRRTPSRRFARALFQWLAGRAADLFDSDFDGLPDYVEDANGNGRADPSETDFLRADTDGDRLPDGAEDANFNGTVDEFETNPRAADSDGDGFFDAADPVPMPVVVTPVLTALAPSVAPAEGGTLIEVRGRNFPPDPQVWFGDLRSPHAVRVESTRLLASVPPLPFRHDRGPMTVRITQPQGESEATLQDAFAYRGRSTARILLESVERVRRQYDGYRGAFRITMDVPDVKLQDIRFFLRVNPNQALSNVEPITSNALTAYGRTLRLRDMGGGLFRVSLSPGDLLTGPVELGVLQWRVPQVPPRREMVRIRVLYPALRVRWGGFLNLQADDFVLDLREAGSPEPSP